MRYGRRRRRRRRTYVGTCSVALPPCRQYVPQACFFLSFDTHENQLMTNRIHSCTTSVGLPSSFFQAAIDFYDCLEILEWILERNSIAKVSSWTKQKNWSKKYLVFFMWQGQRNLKKILLRHGWTRLSTCHTNFSHLIEGGTFNT